ncbi:MAG: adenine-specific methyltransferase EcoRI family protein [Hydrotalea sp.]|nr:adenine-specific methyltransferase EcoRI family protein [Hydrotalea sp.]
MKNSNLRKAAREKNDEFYTQLVDIEKEIKNYKEYLAGKVVLCNCDDPEKSNFWKYFYMNFDLIGLKKLISTHYKPSTILDISEQAYKLEYDGKEIIRTNLRGEGDFRSEECVDILKQADVVCTNPPFSLFREYVKQLMDYEKKFLIIGNMNAITYKEVFLLIKNNKMWLGVDNNGTKWFRVPDHYDIATESRKKIENGIKFFSMGSVMWFTNLDNKKRHEDLTLGKKYNKTDYPKYDNYDAINVDKTSDIPVDYDGAMGVPITFLDKYNPDQFEIVGLGISNSGLDIGVRPYKPEHKKYRKEIQKRGAVDGDLYMMVNGEVEVPYARIIIKKK